MELPEARTMVHQFCNKYLSTINEPMYIYIYIYICIYNNNNNNSKDNFYRRKSIYTKSIYCSFHFF